MPSFFLPLSTNILLPTAAATIYWQQRVDHVKIHGFFFLFLGSIEILFAWQSNMDLTNERSMYLLEQWKSHLVGGGSLSHSTKYKPEKQIDSSKMEKERVNNHVFTETLQHRTAQMMHWTSFS